MTAEITGTVTLRVVAINGEQDVHARHPIIMTGMPIRLRPYDTGRRKLQRLQEASPYSGETDADGRVRFSVPPGRYEVLVHPGETVVDTVDVTAGCDLIHEGEAANRDEAAAQHERAARRLAVAGRRSPDHAHRQASAADRMARFRPGIFPVRARQRDPGDGAGVRHRRGVGAGHQQETSSDGQR